MSPRSLEEAPPCPQTSSSTYYEHFNEKAEKGNSKSSPKDPSLDFPTFPPVGPLVDIHPLKRESGKMERCTLQKPIQNHFPTPFSARKGWENDGLVGRWEEGAILEKLEQS